jgi:uncharacterized membrane protein YkvA (DUF1232 family)
VANINSSHLLVLMKEAGLSPEALALRLGVSNMSVRRWIHGPLSKPLPKIYRNAFEDAVYQLMIDGALNGTSQAVRLVQKSTQSLGFKAALKNLGVSANGAGRRSGDLEQILGGISQIGASPAHQKTVDRSRREILSFKRMGEDWGRRISVLVKALRSQEISAQDKWVAYGALFYLIYPFDLIPDAIPVFGLMDDYAVLGMAMAYFVKKYSRIFQP